MFSQRMQHRAARSAKTKHLSTGTPITSRKRTLQWVKRAIPWFTSLAKHEKQALTTAVRDTVQHKQWTLTWTKGKKEYRAFCKQYGWTPDDACSLVEPATDKGGCDSTASEATDADRMDILSDASQSTCCICMDELDSKADKLLNCKQCKTICHSDCIARGFHLQCPTCREPYTNEQKKKISKTTQRKMCQRKHEVLREVNEDLSESSIATADKVYTIPLNQLLLQPVVRRVILWY
eukprot:TRINITY_DN63243_c0_g1_i2.p1 TRINITY_DN63243_c0_g1~~TRINITY_DN63243_c0_g1_i2.p1  ORF type:complete len:263 (+),score=23.45 TRINITY_DN63243_c0_g1_i2:84-791(+)